MTICPPCLTGAQTTSYNCANGSWQHGTLDIQIIAGVAPNAYIDYEQVVDYLGSSNSNYVKTGLDNVVAFKLAEPERQATGYSPTLVAVNMSLALDPTTQWSTTCPSIPIASELTQLISMGVVPVIAAGNNSWTNGVNSPACFPGVLSVGATYDSSTVYTGCGTNTHQADTVACFSNRSLNYPAVYAPGVNIGATPVYVNNLPQSGTSMAAPHVAGEVAILRAAPGGQSPSVSSLITTIETSGTPVNDGTGSGTNKKRVDISMALTNLKPTITAYKMQIVPSTLSLYVGGPYYGLSVACIDVSGNAEACP